MYLEIQAKFLEKKIKNKNENTYRILRAPDKYLEINTYKLRYSKDKYLEITKFLIYICTYDNTNLPPTY